MAERSRALQGVEVQTDHFIKLFLLWSLSFDSDITMRCFCRGAGKRASSVAAAGIGLKKVAITAAHAAGNRLSTEESAGVNIIDELIQEVATPRTRNLLRDYYERSKVLLAVPLLAKSLPVMCPR